jgi:hypothetical protein
LSLGYSAAVPASLSVKPALMAQANHFLDKDRLLLVVEAHEKRLGRVRNGPLIHGPIIKELGFVPHLLDDIVRRVALGARNS